MSSLARSATAAILLLSCVIGGLWAASVAADNAGTNTHTIERESVTVDYGNTSTVDAANKSGWRGAYRNESVYNASGAQLTEGVDYEWDSDTGEITWLQSSDTTDGETASITYSYDRVTKTGRLVIGIGRTAALVMSILPWLLAAFGVIALLKWAVGSTSSRGR